MNKQIFKEMLGLGAVLWLIGYILGIILFYVVPPSMIGWIITPIGIIITLWVLWKGVKNNSFRYFITLAIVWTVIAVALDYLLIVKMLKPADGYYKLDVYLYYVITLALPLIVGWFKSRPKVSII